MNNIVQSSSSLNQSRDRSFCLSRIPWLFFLAALLLAVPLAYLSDIPERDVAGRYATMAEEFAAGNWAYAFHPRIPMLFSTVCGVLVRLFGISGFSAAKAVSTLCFAATVFPLFSILKRIFGGKTAWGALLVYIVNPFILRMAGSGLRENLKSLLLIMIVHALLLIREKHGAPNRYLYLCICAGLAMITRSEMILFCGLTLFCVMVMETLMRRDRTGSDGDPAAGKRIVPVPFYSLAGTLLTAGVVLIPAIVNDAVFGIPTPEVRFLSLFASIFGRTPTLRDAALIAVLTPVVMAAGAILMGAAFSGKRLKPMLILCCGLFAAALAVLFIRQALRSDPEQLDAFAEAFRRAFDWKWTIPALIGIIWRIRTRKYSSPETLLLAVIAVHTALVTLQVLLSDRTLVFSMRYLLPATPLGFGWTFCGIAVIAGLAGRYVPRLTERTALAVLLSVYVAGELFHCLGPTLKEYFEPRHSAVRRGTLQLAEIIRARRPAQSRATPPPFDLITYEGSSSPGVFFEHTGKYCVSAYLAGGRVVQDKDRADFYVAAPRRLPEEPPNPPGEGWQPLEAPVPMAPGEFSVVYCREEI